ncbi:MAG: DUF58 domain-containing protein [Proteobacteria bacterium]|nr:DUF58 domain-containing protein [Pseudomonadota bacterium]
MGELELRLTEDGRMLTLACGVLAVVVATTGNNQLALLLAVGVALLVLGAPLTSWNLRGLTARRRLPAEIFAGRAGHGRWVLVNSRRFMAARGVRVRELRQHSESRFPDVAPGTHGSAAAAWSFDTRGHVHLDRFVLISAFPFGLWSAELSISGPVDLLVFPKPLGSRGRMAAAWEGDVEGERATRGATGDLIGLREYHAGDRPSAIHWRSTARLRTPMVVDRAGDVGRAVEIEVAESEDPSQWERELSRACGAVLAGFREGYAVGLRLGDARLAPERGGAWRRRLLGALGTAETR